MKDTTTKDGVEFWWPYTMRVRIGPPRMPIPRYHGSSVWGKPRPLFVDTELSPETKTAMIV